MTDQSLVTIITPFRNAAAYLGEAIASVQAQTAENWELKLVNDDSTDRSTAIAREFSECDSRIEMLQSSAGSSRGAAAARNVGMQAGRGEFFAFLDADDVFEPHMLETVLAAADANPAAAMVFGPTRWWHPEGQGADWVEPMDGFVGRLHQPPRLLRLIALLQDGHVPCTCSVLVRRNAIRAIGGFEESFRLYEDQALWAKLLLHFPAYVTPVCLARYRQHSSSVCAVAAERGLYDRTGEHPARAAFLDWLSDYVAGSGLRDKGLERALRLARAPYMKPVRILDRTDQLMLMTILRLRRTGRTIARKFV